MATVSGHVQAEELGVQPGQKSIMETATEKREPVTKGRENEVGGMGGEATPDFLASTDQEELLHLGSTKVLCISLVNPFLDMI